MATKATTITDPMQEKEEIFLPVISGEEPTVYVSLNNYSALIPRGQRVIVPKPVAEMLRDIDTRSMENMAWSKSEQEKAHKALTPDGDTIRL